MKIKKILKQSQIIRNIYFLIKGAGQFFRLQPVFLVQKYIWYFNSYRKYYSMSLKNENSFLNNVTLLNSSLMSS